MYSRSTTKDVRYNDRADDLERPLTDSVGHIVSEAVRYLGSGQPRTKYCFVKYTCVNQASDQSTMTTPSTLPVVQSHPLDIPSEPAEQAQFDGDVAHLFRRITGRFPRGYVPPAQATKPPKRKRETR